MLPRLAPLVPVQPGHEAKRQSRTSLFVEVAVSPISGSRGSVGGDQHDPLPRLAQVIPEHPVHEAKSLEWITTCWWPQSGKLNQQPRQLRMKNPQS